MRIVVLSVGALTLTSIVVSGALLLQPDDDTSRAVAPVVGGGAPSELEVCFARPKATAVTLWADGPTARMANAGPEVGTVCGRWTVPSGEYQVGAYGPEFRQGCELTLTMERDGRPIYRVTRTATLGTGAVPVTVSATQTSRILFERRCPA